MLIIDESYVTVPQIVAMFESMSRKRTIVDYGFRLPSRWTTARSKWDEFTERIGQTVTCRPRPARTARTRTWRCCQIIRLTGLVDPRSSPSSPRKTRSTTSWAGARSRRRDERVSSPPSRRRWPKELTTHLSLAERAASVSTCTPTSTPCARVELLREAAPGHLRR